jgi:SPX domain protein involved in polyphosphate accumulation
MTVGYGDIVPVTNPEKVFVTIITYLITGVFGYVITTIGSVIYRLRELENQYQAKIRIINKIINARGLPNEL